MTPPVEKSLVTGKACYKAIRRDLLISSANGCSNNNVAPRSTKLGVDGSHRSVARRQPEEKNFP